MKIRNILTALICPKAAIFPLAAQDVAGSSDHPLIKRIEGSEIFFSSKADYDKLKLALSKVE